MAHNIIFFSLWNNSRNNPGVASPSHGSTPVSTVLQKSVRFFIKSMCFLENALEIFFQISGIFQH